MQQLYLNPRPLAQEEDALARTATTTLSEDSVIKNNNENGLHVFTINLMLMPMAMEYPPGA